MTLGRPRTGVGGRAAVAVSGVVLAHLAGYIAVFPEPGDRARVLAATGHGYWHLAVLAATAAGVCAVVTAFGRGVERVRGKVPPITSGSADGVAAWLAQARFQMLLFAAMEVSERVASGRPALVVLHERTFAVGIGLQALVAAVAVIVMSLIERAGTRVAMAMARRDRAPATPRPPWRRTLTTLGCAGIPASRHARAPPLTG